MNCRTCGKGVIDTGYGLVHVGGGKVEQECRMCGWKGGQEGGYTNCPRCGDATALINNHTAN